MACRDEAKQQVSLEDYSVSNRGLRSGLVGTPAQVREQIAAFEAVGVDFLLLQCSPQREEMERFAATIITPTLTIEWRIRLTKCNKCHIISEVSQNARDYVTL